MIYLSPIYPITLTFHQDDVSLLKSLDVFSFISRVQTVVFEGAGIERFVIEAIFSETADVRHGGANQPDFEISDDVTWHILPRLDVFSFTRCMRTVIFETGYFQWLVTAEVRNVASGV